MTQESPKPTPKLYRKIAVKAGVYTQSFVDPMTGELVSETVYISPEYLRQSAWSTMQMMKRNLDVPVCADHQDSAIPRARRPVGQWLKEEMYGAVGLLREVKYNPASESHEYLFEVNDPKIAEKMDNGTIKKVSPNFHNEFSPGDGTRWKNVIGHLALTFRPVDYHQSNAPIEAVRSDGQRRFSVIARQNNNILIVPMSALRYTDLRGMVRQDAKGKFIFKSLDYTFAFGTMSKFESWLKAKYRQTIQMSASGKQALLYFAVMHAPIGGVVINGKRYAGGQFIPTSSIDSLPAPDQARIKQSIADSDKKRAAYHAKFRNENETWHEALTRHVGEHANADMTPADSAAAKRRMNSLRAHHGNAVMHRITALAGSEAKQLETLNPDSDKAMHLKRRLRAYHEMGKMLQPGDVPAATGMKSAASETVDRNKHASALSEMADAAGDVEAGKKAAHEKSVLFKTQSAHEYKNLPPHIQERVTKMAKAIDDNPDMDNMEHELAMSEIAEEIHDAYDYGGTTTAEDDKPEEPTGWVKELAGMTRKQIRDKHYAMTKDLKPKVKAEPAKVEESKPLAEYEEASGKIRKYRIEKEGKNHVVKYDRTDPDTGSVLETNRYFEAASPSSAKETLLRHLHDLHKTNNGNVTVHDEDMKAKHEGTIKQHKDAAEKAERDEKEKRDTANAKMMNNMTAREELRKKVATTKHKREKHFTTDAEGKPIGEVTGVRHGNFLVHRPPFDDEGGKATSGSRKRHNDKGFTLTHIPSGKAAALGLSSQNEGLERAHLLESHGNWSKKDLDQATLEHGARVSRHHNSGDYAAALAAPDIKGEKLAQGEAKAKADFDKAIRDHGYESKEHVAAGRAWEEANGKLLDHRKASTPKPKHKNPDYIGEGFAAKPDRGAEFGKENPWHAKREDVFAEMRRLHDELTHHEKTNQSMQPPHGTIGWGGADFDSLNKREVAGAYLSELNKGNHPDVAWKAAIEAGKNSVKIWNERTSKGRASAGGAFQNKRWEGMGDSYADDIHRRFTRYGPPGSPSVGPLASRDANGKGDTVVATGRKDYDAANRAANADDIEARKRGETSTVSEGERGARKFMDQLYRHVDEKDKGAFITPHDLQPIKDWHASLSDDDKEKFFQHLKKSGALTDIKYTKARKAPKGHTHDMLYEAYRTATGNYRQHMHEQKKADQYRDKPFSESEHYKRHVIHGPKQMGVVHAPKGGSDAQGHHYAGGQFTPQDANATGANTEAHASAPAQQEKEHFHRRSASHAKTLNLKPQAVDIKGVGKVNNTLVHGQLAIHPNGQGQWRVTHMPTGKRVGQDTHRDAAVHKAYLLHHGLDWNFTGDADAKHAARFQDVSRGVQPRDLKAENLQAGGALPSQKIDPAAAALNWMKHEPHYLQAKGKYIAKNGTFDANGNLMSIPLNVDDWREHIPGYTGTNAHENHAAASYANERLMSEMLEQMKGKGNGKVVILGGGSGSGKGTSVGKHFDERQYPIRLDQTSSDYDKLVDKIRSLKQHGYQPDIVFVDRPPDQAWQGVVHRAMKSHEKGEPPRTVPPKVAVHSNIEARKVALRMAKENPDIPLRVIDAHAGDPDKSRLLENPQDIIGHLEPQQYDINEELDKAHKHVDELAGNGHVPGHIAKALKQPVDW